MCASTCATVKLSADYRLYVDNWGITSHTIGARYFVHLSPHLERSRIGTNTGLGVSLTY